MYTLSNTSKERLKTCDGRLQILVEELAKLMNITVLEGHRNQAAQDLAVQQGRSKTPWPTSKHNRTPSLAVDIAPYPINWNDLSRFYYMAGIVAGLASQLKIKIRWGGDFNQNKNFKDDKFIDMPHFELLEG